MLVASASISHINQVALTNVEPLNNRGGARLTPETGSAKPSIFQRAWSIAKDFAVDAIIGTVAVAFVLLCVAIPPIGALTIVVLYVISKSA